MKFRVLAACAALASLSAGQALAGAAITAKLAAPVAERTKLVAGGALFICEGEACVAPTAASQTFGVATCKVIAEKVGAVAAFSGRKALGDSKLADCNAKARAAPGGALPKP